MIEEVLLIKKALNKVREENIMCLLSSTCNGIILSKCPSGYYWWCGTTDWVVIGCTIFADKSATYISVSYLLLLRDLTTCDGYAWGVATLVHMYPMSL